MSVIEARYHDSVNVLQELFADDDTASSPFDRMDWYALLAQTGINPLVAMASDERDRAALVLAERDGRITTFRNWYSFTWRPLISGSLPSQPLLAAIAHQLKHKAHRVILDPVPDEDRSATHLARAFSTAGWRVEVSQCDLNHVLNVNNQSFEQYWADRPGHLRSAVKRKRGRIDCQVLTHFDDAAWKAYEAIYSASWKPTEDQPDMLRAFAQAEGKAGRLRLGVARDGDTPVAAQFWTVERGIAYIHKLAHLESARSLSAGTLLTASLFEHVIDTDKVALVDFGTGDQPYKSDWMNGTRPRYRIDCLSMRRPRAWLDLARLAASRLRATNVPTLAPEPPRE